MKNFTLNWLKRHINFYEEDTVSLLEKIEQTLTDKGIEVEEIKFKNPLIVVSINKIERKDGLKVAICQTKIPMHLKKYLPYDSEVIQVLCGASNPRETLKVVLAPVGTEINGVEISHRQIRGLESHGMFCSWQEIGEAIQNDGIIESNLKEGSIFRLEDVCIRVSEPTNRWDLMSVRGVARELAHAGLGILQDLPCHVGQFSMDIPIESSVDISASFFTVKNIVVLPEIKRLLGAIKEASSSDLKCLNDFVLLDVGHPIHIYDSENVRAISLKKAVKNEEHKTLKNLFTTNGDEILIYLNDEPACVGGIIGIQGFNETTQNVIIEAAYFRPENISSLCTKASKLFHLGIDSEQETLGYVGSLITGKISSVKKTHGHMETKDKIYLTYSQFLRTTQMSVSLEKISKSLKKYGFLTEVVRKKRDDSINDEYGVECIPPSWRTDVCIPEDLIEEILRIFGMDNYLNEKPLLKINTQLIYNDLYEKTRNFLCAQGFTEMYNFPFASSGEIKILNALNSEKSFMRTSLLESLKNNCKETLAHGYDFCLLFEIGKVYPSEEIKLGILIKGEEPREWNKTRRIYDFFFLKELLLKLGDFLEIDVHSATMQTQENFDFLLQMNSGIAGRLANQEKNRHLDQTFFAEIVITPRTTVYETRPQQKFYRDLSIVLRKTLTFEEISQSIVVEHYLFDRFEKADGINYGFTLIFLDSDEQKIEEHLLKIKHSLLRL